MGRDEPNLQLPSFRLRRRDRAPAPSSAPSDEHRPAAPPRTAEATSGGGSTGAARGAGAARGRWSTRGPVVPPLVAALVAGLVAGLAVVGLSAAALGACEAVRGASTCGRAGAPLLLAALVLGAVLGAATLVLLGCHDVVGTGVLATSLVAVLALLFLSDTMSTATLLVVVPLMSAAAWVLAHWVTTTYSDEQARSTDTTPRR